MHKPFSAFFLLFAFSFSLLAQEPSSQGENADNVLYRNEASFGLFIHSAGGFGIAYRRGKHITGFSKKMFESELSNFKSAKEVKNFNSYFTTGNSGYIYGKLNSILLLRNGIGYQNILFRKVTRQNVEIRYIAFAGLTLAFLKPMYLYVTDTSGQFTRLTKKYEPELYTQNDIIGKAKFSIGLNETKIIPGAYVKTGIGFDYSENYSAIKAIELGLIMDLYPKALQIMAYSKNRNPLFSIYIKMIWGNKWY